MTHSECMREAIRMAVENVEAGNGGPFAALVVKDGRIVGSGTNRVTSTHDPTAHAEIVAIRKACVILGTFHLAGCVLYTSCEPCPMCLGAIYWAHLDHVYYAGTHEDAAAIGFDDAHIYAELARSPEERDIPMTNLLPGEAQAAFDAWRRFENRVEY